jgi:outer membrane scaffolding protein for murein synthesis (MipA/OmpV family)
MFRTLIAAALLVSAATPAFAQDAPPPLPDPLDQSDTLTIGAGVAFLPDYEGSDDYEISPAVAIRGRVGGMSFFSRATWLYLDVIPRGSDKVDFDVGPIVGARMNRTGKVKDNSVEDLPELDTAIEVGAFAGVTYHGLTNPYDALSFRLDVVHDVGGAHKSTVITPTVDFGTPLSRTTYVGASLSADFAGGGYADYYFGIDPSDALASGLPVYNPDGGMKSWRLGLLLGQSLSGDLTKGFALFATGSYSHLVGDFKDSPIVDDRGSASQWMGAVGVGYTF